MENRQTSARIGIQRTYDRVVALLAVAIGAVTAAFAFSACSPSGREAAPAATLETHPEKRNATDSEVPLEFRAPSIASMPRAKKVSAVGYPTDVIGNGNLKRAFIKRDRGVQAGANPAVVGSFANASCVGGEVLERNFSEGGYNGFQPLISYVSKSPSEILGFDVDIANRAASIESDLTEFIHSGNENTDFVYYNPASYLRGSISLTKPRLRRFGSEFCGTAYVDRVTLVGRIIVILKVTYGSPQDRAKIEESFRVSNIDLAKLLIEIKRDPSVYRGMLKFAIAAYQIGGDVTKLADNFAGASRVECTPDDMAACEGVYKNLANYSTDTEAGLPTQLTPLSIPGPAAIPTGFGDLRTLPGTSQDETLM